MQLECQLLALGIPSVILRLRDLVEDWRKILAVSPSVIFVLDGGCQAVAHVNPPCVTPMIFVDCDNNDPLYYKILPDYPSLFGQARQKLGREDLLLAGGDKKIIRRAAARYTVAALVNAQERIGEFERDLKFNANAQAGMEALLAGILEGR